VALGSARDRARRPRSAGAPSPPSRDAGGGTRNVLVERANGSRVVQPFRGPRRPGRQLVEVARDPG
jgi:hypothetical protein